MTERGQPREDRRRALRRTARVSADCRSPSEYWSGSRRSTCEVGSSDRRLARSSMPRTSPALRPAVSAPATRWRASGSPRRRRPALGPSPVVEGAAGLAAQELAGLAVREGRDVDARPAPLDAEVGEARGDHEGAPPEGVREGRGDGSGGLRVEPVDMDERALQPRPERIRVARLADGHAELLCDADQRRLGRQGRRPDADASVARREGRGLRAGEVLDEVGLADPGHAVDHAHARRLGLEERAAQRAELAGATDEHLFDRRRAPGGRRRRARLRATRRGTARADLEARQRRVLALDDVAELAAAPLQHGLLERGEPPREHGALRPDVRGVDPGIGEDAAQVDGLRVHAGELPPEPPHRAHDRRLGPSSRRYHAAARADPETIAVAGAGAPARRAAHPRVSSATSVPTSPNTTAAIDRQRRPHTAHPPDAPPRELLLPRALVATAGSTASASSRRPAPRGAAPRCPTPSAPSARRRSAAPLGPRPAAGRRATGPPPSARPRRRCPTGSRCCAMWLHAHGGPRRPATGQPGGSAGRAIGGITWTAASS